MVIFKHALEGPGCIPGLLLPEADASLYCGVNGELPIYAIMGSEVKWGVL